MEFIKNQCSEWLLKSTRSAAFIASTSGLAFLAAVAFLGGSTDVRGGLLVVAEGMEVLADLVERVDVPVVVGMMFSSNIWAGSSTSP